MAVHGHGHFSLPYDCHAGLANWHSGWSAGKKARVSQTKAVTLAVLRAMFSASRLEQRNVQGWCCAHEHTGCEGAGGGGGGGGGGGLPKPTLQKAVKAKELRNSHLVAGTHIIHVIHHVHGGGGYYSQSLRWSHRERSKKIVCARIGL